MKRYKNYYGFNNELNRSDFTEEQKQWILDHYKGISAKELSIRFNNTFNTNYNERKFIDYKSRYKLRSGYTYNAREKENFSETKRVDGFTYIKIENGVWIPKHRYIYEQNIGKIPTGYAVIFKDNNKENFNLSNLVLVHRKVLNTITMELTNDPDINESILLLGKLKRKTKKIERELEGK
jgi:hypothetical protein